MPAGGGYGVRVGNRLGEASSPYLRQHASNPVDWYQWGDEAFAAARSRQVPVLLSVGYASCHWCHVMAHESFEDQATAAEMNRAFVNVKVDREERPDVDAVYMEAVQALTGRGGWPMTVFLTPDGEPFHAGTYFPPEDRHGMPSFRRVLTAVEEAWKERRSEVVSQAGELTRAIGRRVPPADEAPGLATLQAAYEAIASSFDPTYGGFGAAPKFPQQPVLEFLLRVLRLPWAGGAAYMLGSTLDAMARGGIHDQIGGGFARYSVDSAWLVPHFEKMLYDNAQLARLYLWAWRELGEDAYRSVAVSTLEYMLRDLGQPDGGFWSGEDADSEGEEGRFYVFTADEMREAVGEDDFEPASLFFGVTAEGNFEGSNVLHQARTIDEVTAATGATAEEVEAALTRTRDRLATARSTRVRPGLDDKVVTSWNGLALRALAEAGAVLEEPRYLDAARRTARFLLDRLHRADGRLLRSWSPHAPQGDGVAGFLEDHAALAVGLVALYQATGETEWHAAARRTVDAMLDLFDYGTLRRVGRDAEQLVADPQDLFDNPLPSGNSLAAEALLQLSLSTGEQRYREAAEAALRAGAGIAARYPTAVGHLLAVAASVETGLKEVAVVGPEAESLVRVVWERFRPGVLLASSADGNGTDEVPLLADRWRPGETLAYVCEGFVCQAPVSDPTALRAELG